MYGKIFKQMYKGTLAMVGPWEALVTFQQMIVLADKDGVVDMTADAISRETTIPLKIIKKGITALEQPDPESRTPDEEGRRIVLLADGRAWGWRIVNYAHYCKLRSEEERRDYHRNYWREKRSKSATKKPLNTTQQNSTDSTHVVSSKYNIVSSTYRGTPSKRCPKDYQPKIDLILKLCAETKLSESFLLEELSLMKDHEFKNAKKDWDSVFRNWVRRSVKWQRSRQKLTYAEQLAEDIRANR